MAKARNISTGPRGAWRGVTLVMAEPGEVIEADDFEPEWFEIVGEDQAEGDDLSALKVAELKAIAVSEGIDLADVSKKADIISAIELAREAAAADQE